MVQCYQVRNGETQIAHAAIMPIPCESIGDFLHLDVHRLYLARRHGGKIAGKVQWELQSFLPHQEYPPIDLETQLGPLWSNREERLLAHYKETGFLERMKDQQREGEGRINRKEIERRSNALE
jgi:hypothetical protein